MRRAPVGGPGAIRWLPCVAVALPPVMWLAAAALILSASLAGYRAFAAPADLTLAEAAAIRDEAEVLRQIRAGADPNAADTVRRGMIRDPAYTLTPLEAAIAARHGEVVRLLLDNGAELNGTNTPVLLCLAREGGAADIVAFLQARAPSDIVSGCENVQLPI